MATIIAVFQKYSEREGEQHKLKKSELRDLLHDELPGLLGVRRRDASEPSFLLEPYCALGNSRSSSTESPLFIFKRVPDIFQGPTSSDLLTVFLSYNRIIAAFLDNCKTALCLE